MEPSGERFSGTWPRSGTTLSGIAYRLRPLAPRTAATGSLPLLPTPRASLNELRTGKRTPSQEAGAHGRYLSSEVMRLLPTPRERDWKGSGFEDQLPNVVKLLPTPNASLQNYDEDPAQFEARRLTLKERHGNGNGIGTPLPIALKLLPTPVAGDGREKGGGGRWNAKSAPLEQTIKEEALPSSGASTSPPSADGKPSTGLRLNPSFVEWMMGAPTCGVCGLGWTDPDCPHSATAYTSTSAGSSASTSSASSESG
jgi:hypothetical protein